MPLARSHNDSKPVDLTHMSADMAMKFFHPQADVYIPRENLSARTALARVTHLCVAAHQDDIEIMAHAGICDCLDSPQDRAFGGVIVTNGAGSPRTGAYAQLTDAEMQAVRRKEQRLAASLGDYAIQIQLAYPSVDVKRPDHPGLAADLDYIFASCRPRIVYLHNPADKHDTHVAVLTRCIEALRRLPPDRQPQQVFGCEVWRDLDWLPDELKSGLDASRRRDLAAALLQVFASQIGSGKRYDIATLGRRDANATFHDSRAADGLTGITWAINLTPLLMEPTQSLADFTAETIDRFRQEVLNRIRRYS